MQIQQIFGFQDLWLKAIMLMYDTPIKFHKCIILAFHVLNSKVIFLFLTTETLPFNKGNMSLSHRGIPIEVPQNFVDVAYDSFKKTNDLHHVRRDRGQDRFSYDSSLC